MPSKDASISHLTWLVCIPYLAKMSDLENSDVSFKLHISPTTGSSASLMSDSLLLNVMELVIKERCTEKVTYIV